MIYKSKMAAALAFLIGVMSVFAGAMAMQGWDPGYSVLGWLPVYNFIMGILTVLVPTVLIWRNSSRAMTSAVVFFGIHVGATTLLLLVFRENAAIQSIFAMMFRLTAWLVILALLYFQTSRNKKPIN